MKKYKVNIDRQKPSSEEILSGRNFDELLKQYKAAVPGQVVKKPSWKSGWFIGSVAAAVAVVTGIFIYTGQDSNEQPANAPRIVQQPVIDANDSAAVQDNSAPVNAFTPVKRRIAPPLPGLNIRSFAYKFKTAFGGTFTHTSGTKVTFPANAFVDANGNPVSGNIEIQYREFRDQVDFFLSGIPMQYDSAQHTYQFVSAGMMEITGFINGQPVFLAKGKTVNVEFASKNQGTQFNLYRFDTLAGNWNYLGKDRVVLTPEQKIDSASLVAEALKGPGKMCSFIGEKPKPVEPVKPLKADKRKNRFTVAIDAKEFPEMKSYKDMIFEVDESSQKFDRSWYKVTWESIILSKTERENKYKITLAKGREVVVLDVYPVFDDKNFETEMAAYQVKLLQYQKDIDEYNQMLEQQKARANGILDNGNGTIVKPVDGGFMYYTKPKPEDMEKAEEVMRCFTISKFGVYNMDAIEELPVGGIITLTMNDTDGKLFSDFATVYHVDRRKNSLFTYHNENPVAGFHFNPASSNLVWGVKDGKLFYADNDQFGKQPRSGKGSLVMKPVGKEFKTAEEMKRFFKISPSI